MNRTLLPATGVSWAAAKSYCGSVGGRLPTEAEWEYAARGGTSTRYYDRLPDIAWFADNSDAGPHAVGGKIPNAYGLHDMLGNVSEWTLDQYDSEAYEKLDENVKDPTTAPASKYPRVGRGGSYVDDASAINCTNRIPSKPEWNQRDPQIPKSRWWLTDGMFMGFRVVRPVEQPSKEDIESFYARYLK